MADSASDCCTQAPAERDSPIQRAAPKDNSYSRNAAEPGCLGSSVLLGIPDNHSTRKRRRTYNATTTQVSAASGSSIDTVAALQMIPPTSSFYDPDQAATQQTQDYQQWIDAYSHGQVQYGGSLPNSQLSTSVYQQPLAHGGDMQHNMHSDGSQFNYVPTPHYASAPSHGYGNEQLPPFISRQSQRRGTVTANSAVPRSQNRQQAPAVPGIGSTANANVLHGSMVYNPQSQNTPSPNINDPYYFPMAPFPNAYATPDPQHAQSHYAQPHTQTHTPSDPMSAGTAYTPSSGYMDLQHSSVSPPNTSTSWHGEDSTQPQPQSVSVHSSGRSGMGPSVSAPSFVRPPPVSANTSTTAAPSHPVNNAGSTRVGAATGKRSRGSAPTAPGRARSRKRIRKEPAGDGGDDSDTSSDEEGVGAGGGGAGGMGGMGSMGRPSRLPGACTHCKKLKMKCDFPKNKNICKRCETGGHHCVVEGRKPRTAPNKREYLLAQIRQKDAIIESLLKQLHNPYLATPLSIASYRMATSPSDKNNQDVIAWLDRLQASVRTAGGQGGPAAFKLSSRQHQEGGAEDRESESEEEEEMHTAPEDEDEDGDVGNGPATLPDAAVPLGLIANLSLSNTTKGKAKSKQKTAKEREDSLDDDNVGVANETYFLPGPASDLTIRATLIEQHSPPEILVHGLVTPQDVDKLFDIFYTKINPFLCLLNPILHTPSTTFARCPFLFTVMCAISSRFYPEKSEIYAIAMHFAKSEAANALINGWKSVELCQAYLLMSYYAVPAKRWEDDRSWLYTGLAIRLATDLNLHQPSSLKSANEKQALEVLNRTRTWMICFNLDRSVATQFGKPSTIKEDYITRHCKDWYKSSSYNDKCDIHVCAYSTLLRLVAEFHETIYSNPDSPTGLNKTLDFLDVTLSYDRRLTEFDQEWSHRFAEDSDLDDPACSLRSALLPFLVNYSRLVMYSFGFQQAFERGMEASDHLFFTKCLESAKAVVRTMIEDLAPSGYMRYSPDGHFVFAAFASAFLLKLLRPEFADLLTAESETEIFDLIARLIQIQSSPDIAIDDRHTPKLYARFLAGLLSKYRRDGATSGRLHTYQPPSNQGNTNTSAGFPIPPGSTSSSQVFSVAPPQPGYQDRGHTRTVSGQETRPITPVYEPETTYAQGTGPIDVGGFLDSGGFAFGDMNSGFDEEMLATMRAIKNPAWWDNMMMPGFSWSNNNAMMQDEVVGHSAQYSTSLMSGLPNLHVAEVPTS